MLISSKNAMGSIALALTATAGVAIAQELAFEGWYINSSGDAERISCTGYETMTFTSTYAGCCGSTCTIYTAAAGTLGIDYFSQTYTCSSGSEFHTMTIYDQAPGPSITADASYVRYMCTDAWEASSIYRKLADDTTTTPSGTAVSTSSPSSPSSNSSSTSPANSSSPASSSPPVWIAGAVAGPVVAIALIGAIAFCIGRRKRAARGQPIPSMPPDGGEGAAYFGAAGVSPPMSQKHLSGYQQANTYDQKRWTQMANGRYSAYHPVPSPSPSHLSPVSYEPHPGEPQELSSTHEEPEPQQLP